MPEGDTIWHTAIVLRDLTGQVVDEVISRGKHLFIRIGSASIHSHLKMEGSWKVNPVSKPSRASHRIRIILEAGDIQAAGIDLGVLEVLEREHDMDTVAHLGPDLLDDNWDPHVAAANLTGDPHRPLAETLLDQRVMAGVGNVYCNELCFVTGHLPTSPVKNVTDPLRLVQRARDMLWLNRSRWNRSTTGDTRHGRDLWVYGRAGKPCRRCGTLIESSAAHARSSEDLSGDRIAYWCPVCQT
jgi:endonuclease-8